MKVDLGEEHELVLELRHRRSKPHRFVWTVGPVRDTVPEDRVPGPPPTYKQPPGKVDLFVDLQSDKKVDFAFGPRDEMGNPTTFDGTLAFSVDDPSVVTLTDNGDGTGTVAAVGVLGVATLTGTATPNDGSDAITGAEAINVIAGDTASFAFTFDEPTEVTPDDAP